MAAVALRAAHVAREGQLGQALAGGVELLGGEGDGKAQRGALDEAGTGGAGAHGHVPAVPLGGTDVEHREVGGAAAHDLEARAVVVLVHDHVGEDVALVAHLGKGREAHGAGPHELDLGVKGEQRGEDVGEAKAAKDGAAHGGEVAHLGAHDVAHGALEDVAGGVVEGLMALKLAQGHHGPDDEGVLGLLDLVEAAGGQVDDRRDAAVLEAKPDAASHDAVHATLADKLVRLLDRVGACVVLELEHISPSDIGRAAHPRAVICRARMTRPRATTRAWAASARPMARGAPS